MKKRLLAILLAVFLLSGTLVGCSGESKNPEGDTKGSETINTTVQTEEDLSDLEALYNKGMEVLAQMGKEAPVLFPETNIDYLNEFYPGLADIEFKQFYAGVAPVTNAPFEIILAEVADEKDVQTMLEIYQARVDGETDDATYPENAEAWMNNCKITSRGCFVFLAVLMDPCEIPEEFILD